MTNPVNIEDTINLILKNLKESDFISIFFLLMDSLTTTKEYFEIINMDRCHKEAQLKKVLKKTREERDTLLQVLALMQKYNLLKLLNSCKHKMKNEDSFDKISPLWKLLYKVCELITSTKDVKALKQSLPEAETCEFPEIIFVHAYHAKIFSDRDLSGLSSLFRNERPDISAKLDMNNGKVCNIKYYPIRTPRPGLPCGLAVIINHENFPESSFLKTRKDSLLDVEALKQLWEIFGFQTSVYNDLTDKQVIDLFQKLARTDHSAYDIFICCYMSHGAEGMVFASNSKPILISDFVNIIANECPTLEEKPKLFFIQACQGSQIQKGISSQPIKLPECASYTKINLESNTPYTKINLESNTPLNCDVLKLISSIPGYTSFVPPGKMSWFIQALVNKMKDYGKDLDMYDVVLKVQEEVSQKKGSVTTSNEVINNCKQTVIAEQTLRRRLKLKLLQD